MSSKEYKSSAAAAPCGLTMAPGGAAADGAAGPAGGRARGGTTAHEAPCRRRLVSVDDVATCSRPLVRRPSRSVDATRGLAAAVDPVVVRDASVRAVSTIVAPTGVTGSACLAVGARSEAPNGDDGANGCRVVGMDMAATYDDLRT